MYEQLISVEDVDERALSATPKAQVQIEQLVRGQEQIMSVLLAQQEQISRLASALATVRISRTQELAIREAINARAGQLAREESLPGCERKIAGAIRKTLRETTGARATGDLQAAQFDRAMDMAMNWRMSGALRRIRREVQTNG